MLSLAACFASIAPSLAQNNEGLPVIPLNIVNNQSATSPVFVYIRGIVAAATPDIPAGSWVYVSDASGDITIMPNIPNGTYQSLALNLGVVKSATLQLPKLTSARIYVSFGAPVTICCSSPAGVADPAGWGATSNPNFNVLFDWAETNWDNSGNPQLGHTTRLGGNVTQVDMFGMPLLLTLNGQSTSGPGPSIRQAGFTANRSTMLDAYLQLGSPWTNLVMYNNDVPLRAIAPFHGISFQIFPSNELDSYIGKVFTYYGSGNSLQVTGSCAQDGNILHTFQGTTSGGIMSFAESGTARFQFPMPDTLTVYQNQIQASPQPASALYQCLAGVVAAKLGGAFVRTNLLVNTNLDACMTSQFYVNSPIQAYAQIFHTYGVNQLAYSFGYDDTCNQSSYIPVDDPSSLTLTVGGGAAEVPRASHDYNGDHRSDIAWRDTSGDIVGWLMNGGQVLSSGLYGTVPSTWSIVGQRDFNGDGKVDFLWRDTSGNVAIWFLNGTQVSSSGGVGNIPITWTVAATGDFNGDGKGDILWRDISGNVSLWLMNGTQVMGSGGLGNVPLLWSVAGVGDFNGDGMTDLLWRDVAGDTSIWFMNGTQVLLSAGIGNIPAQWSVVGTGDFNDDGMSDIVWRDHSGNTSIWLMSGSQVLSASGLGTVPTTWSVAQTGDYNGDGTSDLLWRDSSGNTAIWFMTAGQISSTAGLGNIPTLWTVQSTNAE